MNSIRCIDDDPLTGNARLILSGRVGIGDAREFRNAALSLIKRNCGISIDCDAVESFDASAIQILLALGREQAIGGKAFDLAGVSENLAHRLALAGLGR